MFEIARTEVHFSARCFLDMPAGRASPCSPLTILPGVASAVLTLYRVSPCKVVVFYKFLLRNVRCVCIVVVMKHLILSQ